MLYDVNFIHIQ